MATLEYDAVCDWIVMLEGRILGAYQSRQVAYAVATEMRADVWYFDGINQDTGAAQMHRIAMFRED